MQRSILYSNKYKHLYKFYCAYAVAIVLSNFFDTWQINFFGVITTGVGSIVFPTSYLIANSITEVYGYKKTITSMWIGFGVYLFAFMSLQLFFSQPTHAHLSIKTLLDRNNQILIASIFSLLCTETFNAAFLSKLKIKMHGRYIGIRFFVSTFIAYLINELIYAPVAYHGLLNQNELLHHIISSWIFMSTIEIIMLPFFVNLARRVKSIEGLDTFDYQIDYNIFNFNARYKNS